MRAECYVIFMPFFKSKKKLGSITKKPKKPKRDSKRYMEERNVAQSGDKSKRLELAKKENTHQEVLYYLAEHDPDKDVRKAVAKNPLTPIHATTVLSKDKDIDVRMALLKRLVHLLPDLTDEEYSSLYAHVVQALSNLALDEVIKIKRTLSATLKDKGYTPPQVASQLAKDVEREVSEPILKYCITIPDEELINIVRQTQFEWAARAIAQREKLEEDVSQAVFERSEDFPKAGEDLIKNQGAKLSADTLHFIIERAKDRPEWHKPLATRSDLPADMVTSIAGFVSSKLRKLMLKQNDFDDKTCEEITEAAKRRMTFLQDRQGNAIKPEKKFENLIRDGHLDEEAIGDALALREYNFVKQALAYRADLAAETVQRMLDTKSPKTVVSLCWKADLSMRMALTIQQELVKINPKEIIYPRRGKTYPLDQETMEFQINFFTDT